MERKSVRVVLTADSELCIAVPPSESWREASIRLVGNGSASAPDARVDVCGAPLVADVAYHLPPGQLVLIFAWTSATIVIEGSAELLHNVGSRGVKSVVRPLVEYHCLLHGARQAAERAQSRGPLVVVCGDNSLGAARTLCNYAARSGWKPLLADMRCDVTQSLCLPGTIAAALVEWPSTVDEAMATTCLVLPYFVGTTEAQRFAADRGEVVMTSAYVHYAHVLLGQICERLARQRDNVYGYSGAIVALPELADTSGSAFVIDLVQRFAASHVLCTGDELVFHKVHAAVAEQRSVQVDKLSHHELALPLASTHDTLAARYTAYFYGEHGIALHPSQWSKPFAQLDILQCAEDGDRFVLVSVERTALQGIVGCVGALFKASGSRQQDTSLLQSSPFAFVRVQSIEPAGVSFLTTTHFTFAGEKLTLVVGSTRWISST